jgi:phenylacetate-CoA ligase
MIEPLIPRHQARWQPFYDQIPSPARHLLTSARGWPLARIRYAPETFSLLHALRTHEPWTASDIASFQLHALRQSLAHARLTVPFYAAYPKIEIDSLDDLRRLPVLTREIVRENQDRLLSSSIAPHRRIRAGTTGTTGANLSVAYTEQLARDNWAFLLRQWAWAGIQPRHPRLTFFGARIVPAKRRHPPFWTHNLPERQVLLSIFHLSESTAPSYLAFLRKHQGEILEGFPSVLSLLADFALLRGQRIPMHVVFTTGEPLYPSFRARIEEAFQARVFDSYGMTEYCGLIQQCERGQMHLAPEYGYLEILNEQDQPVAPGEEGYFVWTGFLNRAMPLIRYRIGDRGRWETGSPCACGRAFTPVVPTITRECEVLRSTDGRIFSAPALAQILNKSDSLRFCQIIHDRPERVIIRAVPSNGRRAAKETMEIRASLQDLFGSAVNVIAELAAAPLSGPSGKIPFIINHVSARRDTVLNMPI